MKKGKNIERNKTTELDKYIPDNLIGQFTTANETGRRGNVE